MRLRQRLHIARPELPTDGSDRISNLPSKAVPGWRRYLRGGISAGTIENVWERGRCFGNDGDFANWVPGSRAAEKVEGRPARGVRFFLIAVGLREGRDAVRLCGLGRRLGRRGTLVEGRGTVVG